jgi:hypothetical protein
MADFPQDPDQQDLEEHYALIYAPKRGRRQRYPENCVQLVSSADEALHGSEPQKHFHPAKVCGPFRSSEGFRLFYLIRWLD